MMQSEHPWPLLEKAQRESKGLTLTAVQVADLLADYCAIVEKNNELMRMVYGTPPENSP